LKDRDIKNYQITPEEFGFKRARPEDIKGGNARENARIIRKILDGEKGPKRDMVLLNSAAAFLVAGIDTSMKEGIERAKEVIDSGRARDKLNALTRFTRQCSPFVRKEL